MKNFRVIIFLFLSYLSILSSCQPINNKKIKVGFLFGDFFAPRWELERDFFKERMSEFGAEVLIADAKGDEVLQHTQALEFIEQNVDVIIITIVNANTAAAIVREAHKKNIKVIAYDGILLNSELDYLVGFDLEKVGEMQANYVLKRKPTGNFILLNGDKAHAAAADVNRGVMKVLKPLLEAGKIKLIYNGWMSNWSGDNAKYYTNKIIEFSGEKVDAIIGASDGIAGGVAEVLWKRKLGEDIIVTGQDGSLPACNRIINNEQSMTVYKSSKRLAYAGADLAYKVANNEKIEGLQYRFNGRVDVPSLILEPVVVDKLNIESTIVADGIYTMEEIMNYKN
jgi:D-xylose transport system substrate-binding protein